MSVKFEASQAGKFGASGTGKRETEIDRENKAKAILAVAPITVIGQLGDVYGNALAAKQELDVQGTLLTIANPKSLACRVCGGVHGQPTAAMVRAGNTEWKGNRLALTFLISQNGKPIVVSETCMYQYFVPQFNKANVTNFADVVKMFGLKK